MALKISKKESFILSFLIKDNLGIDVGVTDVEYLRKLLKEIDASWVDNVDEFYIRIDRQYWDKSLNCINVGWYDIKDINDDNNAAPKISSVFYHKVDIDNNGKLIEQGYEYLKTLPEFEGFEDC